MMGEGDGKDLVLVTGGAGYIGSHAVVELIEAGYNTVVIDNFSNAVQSASSKEKAESILRVEKITGNTVPFHKVDLVNKDEIRALFSKYKFKFVLHLAGLKAVGESSEKPLEYYHVNVGGTINLLEVMAEFGVYNMVFSSSATVYGTPERLPLDESHPVGKCTNPYGKTKYFIEEILRDLVASDKKWSVVVLRYFNPVGAHKSGLIGEDPQGPPNNLMPFVAQVAVGRRPRLSVFGDDYDTPDGTGVRDYIHVVDLAQGHVAAVRRLVAAERSPIEVYNLGTGKGYSVLDMVRGLKKASGRDVPYDVCPRRPGDIGTVYADPKMASAELGWTAQLGLDDMCADLWNFQAKNPRGLSQ